MFTQKSPLRAAAFLAVSALIGISGVSGASAATPVVVSDVNLTVGADATQRNVNWFAASTSTTCVQYSDKANFAKSTTVNAYAGGAASGVANTVYEQATITGLKPEHTYYYRLGDCRASWTSAYKFSTGDRGAFSFMYYGDPQIYTKTDVAAKGWAATLATSTTKFPGTDFLMTAGDNVDSYDPATQPAEWDLFLAPQQITQYAMAPAVGNHDNANGTGLFNEHYGVPNRTSLGQTAPGTGDYWFVYNRTLFLVMNTNSLDLVAHKAFIDQAKAAAGHVEWIVADFHHATFSSADHPNDADVTYLRANLTPILSAEGVDLVLNGHDHDYARSYLMNGSTIVPGSNGSVLKPKEGQVLYVATNSSSGGKFYPLTGPYPWTVVTNQENVANYTRVEVNEGKLVVTTYRATDNSIVDRVTLKK